MDAEIRRELAELEARGRLRRLDETRTRRDLVDFRSNDYLGLSQDASVVEAAREALVIHGAGGGASRLLGGGSLLFSKAERAAADWLGSEAALLFPSGWQANLGLLGTLVRRGDVLFSDERNHASLVDGARLSRARVHVYPHLDLERLETSLSRAAGARRRLVVTESVFSMDGTLAPLAELHELCARHDAWLVVDEAHAVGLLGPEGAGAWASVERSLSDSSRLVARTVTGGKALGVSGAFVCCGESLRELLVNRARSFAFTTAPSPAVPGALRKAIEVCRDADEERTRALSAAEELARRLDLPAPHAAIVPVVIGADETAVRVAEEAVARGYDVGAVRPPTVPPGTSRLRLTTHAHNTREDVVGLARALAETWRFTTPRAPGGELEVKTALARMLVVVGTDTEIGKTIVSALLLRAAQRLGPARYWKPCQTGDDCDTTTVTTLAGARGEELLEPSYRFALPASPHEAAAAEDAEIDFAALRENLARHRREHAEARIVVELAGGLLVPYSMTADQSDLLEQERLPIVLVARSGLGTLNHTRLTLEALRRRHLEPRALFLVGDEHPSNRETLRALGHVERLFEVPRFDPLDTAAIDRWLDANHLDPILEP